MPTCEMSFVHRTWIASVAVMALSAAGVPSQAVAVEAKVAPSTPESFACVTAGRFYLQLHVTCTPTPRLGDRIRFTFRDLFKGRNVASCERAIEKPAGTVTSSCNSMS